MSVWKAHEGKVVALACSADGRVLASVGWDDRLRTWDLATREMLWELPDEGLLCRARGVAYSPDGKYLAVGHRHGALVLDPESGRRIHLIRPNDFRPGDEWLVSTVAFSPNGAFLLGSGCALLGAEACHGPVGWAVGAWEEAFVCGVESGEDGPFDFALSADGQYLAVVGGVVGVKRWRDGQWQHLGICDEVQGCDYDLEDTYPAVVISPDNRYVAFGAGRMLSTWEVAGLLEMHRTVPPEDNARWFGGPWEGFEVRKLPRRIADLQFSTDGGSLLLVGGDDVLRCLEAGTWEERWARRLPVRSAERLLTLPGGDAVVVGGQDGTITVHALADP